MTGFEHSHNDSALILQTPEGIEFVLYSAGFPVRACAWAIDSFIQGIAIFGIILFMAVTSGVTGIWFSLILAFAIDWFYHTAFEVFNGGQSPGKRIMGIRVVCGDGSPVNPGAAFLRNLLRFADSFMSLYLIGFICMIVSPGFRRLGDWAADTLVVYTANAHAPGRFIAMALRKQSLPWLEDVPKVFPSRPLGYEEKQAIHMFACRYPLLGKARADEIAGVWTDKLRMTDSDGISASEPSNYLLGIARGLGGG